MKKLIFAFFAFALVASLHAQKGVTNNGTHLQINNNAFFRVQGSGGHFINKDNGKINLDGTLSISGDWDNQTGNTNIWLNQSNGTIELNGAGAQTIWNTTHFKNLLITNTEGVYPDASLEVDNITIADDGILYGAGQDIKIFGHWNSSNGTFIAESNNISFVGDNSQNLNCATNQEFYDLTINNGHVVNFNNDLAIINLYVTSGSAQATGSTSIDTKLVYNGDAPQVTGDEWPAFSNFNVFIENTSGEGVTLNGNKEIALGKAVTVVTALSLDSDTLSGAGEFMLMPDATLASAHPSGLNGNIQLSGSVTLSPLSHYTYNGILPQETGSLLPDSVMNLTMVNPSGTVTLSRTGHTKVKGILDLEQGQLLVKPGAQLTAVGPVSLGQNPSLELKSDASGTASFIDNGTITGTGKITAERFLDAITTSGWYVSSPVADAHTDMFDAPSSGIWFYNSTVPGWQQAQNTVLDKMTGYVTKYALPFSLPLNGTPNTGDITRNDLIRTTVPNNYGWNLIGNPYPSAYNWDSASYYNLNSAIYIRKSNGAVATYVNGIGVPFGTTGVIPAMQAFWVQVNIAYPMAGLTLSNNGRLHDALPFYKAPVNHELIRLTANNNFASDELVVYFAPNASKAFNSQMDAYEMYSDNPNQPGLFAYTNTNEKLTIKSVDFNYDPLAVPLGYSSQALGQHRITASDFDNINSSVSIHLEDTYLNVIHDLRQNSIYQFSHNNAEAGDRFILHFNRTAVDNNELEANDSGAINIYASQGSIYIALPAATSDKQIVNVYNMLGQVIHTEILPEGLTLHKINFTGVNGNYLVNVASNNLNTSGKVNIMR